MNKNQLQSYRDRTGYSFAQIEMDYYHHKILAYVYEKYSKIFFKGGTCLQKCYGIKRFSEDLDFNYVGIEEKKLIEDIQNAITDPNSIKETYKTPFGSSYILHIEGPLFDGTDQTKCRVRIDLREGDALLKPIVNVIDPIFEDLPRYTVVAFAEEEILAEKVRALLTRKQARDLFDLYELLKKNIVINYDLIEKKLKSYDISYSKSVLLEKINDLTAMYESELKKLVKIFPSFEECYSKVSESFK